MMVLVDVDPAFLMLRDDAHFARLVGTIRHSKPH